MILLKTDEGSNCSKDVVIVLAPEWIEALRACTECSLVYKLEIVEISSVNLEVFSSGSNDSS